MSEAPEAFDYAAHVARNREEFLARVRSAINCACLENGSNTPDFLLAEYLLGCLDNFDRAVTAREKWYGRGPRLVGADDPVSPATPEQQP